MRLTRYRDILARAETRATDSRPGRALHPARLVSLFVSSTALPPPHDRDSSRRPTVAGLYIKRIIHG